MFQDGFSESVSRNSRRKALSWADSRERLTKARVRLSLTTPATNLVFDTSSARSRELPASTVGAGRTLSFFLCSGVPPGCPAPVCCRCETVCPGRGVQTGWRGPLAQLGMPGAHQQLLVKLELVKLKRHRQPLTADLGGFPGDLAVKALPGGPAVKTSPGGPVVKTALQCRRGFDLWSGSSDPTFLLAKPPKT